MMLLVRDTLSMLDRERSHLLGLSGGAFWANVGAYLAAVATDARVARHLRALEEEAMEGLQQFARHDDLAVEELVSVKQEILRLEPTFTVFPLLIDIAPLEQSGSRNLTPPIEIKLADLLPRAGPAEAVRTRRARRAKRSK